MMHCDVIYLVGINICTRRWLERFCLFVRRGECAEGLQIGLIFLLLPPKSLAAGLHVQLPQAQAC